MATQVRRLRALVTHPVQVSRRRVQAIDKAWYFWEIHQGARRDPILVYSMGKVGSSALSSSLQRASGRPVIHLHNIAKAEHEYHRKWREDRDLLEHQLVWWRGEYVRLRLAMAPRSKKWDVIAGVRDPFSMWVSSFFEAAKQYRYLDPDQSADEVDIDVLVENLCSIVDRLSRDWFTTELQPTTGIDVYARPFPTEKGFQQYESGRFRMLLIRFEDLPMVGPDSLARFLGLDVPVPLVKANVASQKWYSDVYQRFLAEAQIPELVLDQAYKSRQALHFYTREELQAFRCRWSHRSA